MNQSSRNIKENKDGGKKKKVKGQANFNSFLLYLYSVCFSNAYGTK